MQQKILKIGMTAGNGWHGASSKAWLDGVVT